MVAILCLYILGYAIVATAVSMGGYMLVKRLKHRKLSEHQLRGQANALKLKTSLEEVCAFCREPVHPEQDIYEEKIGWYHAACYKDLVE